MTYNIKFHRTLVITRIKTKISQRIVHKPLIVSRPDVCALPISFSAWHVYMPASPYVNCVTYKSPLTNCLIRSCDKSLLTRTFIFPPFFNHVTVGLGADSGLHWMVMFPLRAPTIASCIGFFTKVGANAEKRKSVKRWLVMYFSNNAVISCAKLYYWWKILQQIKYVFNQLCINELYMYSTYKGL